MKVHYTAVLLVLFGLHSLGVNNAFAGKRKRCNKPTPTEHAVAGSTRIVTPSKSLETAESHESEISEYTESEMDALMSSIDSDDLEKVIKIIKKSPKLLYQYNEDGWSPVHYAAFSGRPLILEKFREQFKDRYTEKFTEKTSNGETPFTLSLLSTKTAIYLLSVLPEETPFLTDANGSTPLHIAAKYLNGEMIGRFIDLYPEQQILQKDNLGQNFLHLFANAGGFQNGPSISVVEDQNDDTPLNTNERTGFNFKIDSEFSWLGEKGAPRIPKKIFLRLFYEKDLKGKTPEDLNKEYESECESEYEIEED